jgi:N-acetylglutamate synthase-like GNAT family acetyltransferase
VTTRAEAGIAIRCATADDVEALVALINDAYAISEQNVFPSTTRTGRRDITDAIGDMLVAERDSRIAGCVQLETRGTEAHFGLLAVDATLQGAGIGTALIAHVEGLAREAGCNVMRIEVVKEGVPDRLPYYEQRGYRVVRETPGQAWNNGEDWGAAIDWHMVDMEKAL